MAPPAEKPQRNLSPALLRLIDVAAVVTIVPLFIIAWISIHVAWQTYHPKKRTTRQTPALYDLPAERVSINGGDDLKLAGWFIPAAGARDVIVLAHGLSRNSGSMMSLASSLHTAGYNVLTFDMRNHGASANDGLLRGQSRIAADYHGVVRYLKERPDLSGCRVACLGTSVSTWPALNSARLEPETVRAVICDSGPILEINPVMRRMFDVYSFLMPPPLPLRGPLMFRFGRAVFIRASRFFLVPAPWPPELSEHKPRLLFIVGEADPITPPVDVQEQADLYPWATVWTVPGAGHMQSQIVAADEYVKRVVAVLDEAFDRGGKPRADTAKLSDPS